MSDGEFIVQVWALTWHVYSEDEDGSKWYCIIISYHIISFWCSASHIKSAVLFVMMIGLAEN